MSVFQRVSRLSNLTLKSLNPSCSIIATRGAKKAAKGAAAKTKKVLDVETDPEKLVNYCCGANYNLEGEEVKLKPNEEYPDWLFTMDVKRPRPKSWEIEDKESLAYFEACRDEARIKWRRLSSQGLIGLRDKK